MKIKPTTIVTEEANSNTEEGLTQLATNYIAAVGGTDNLKAIDACITRLRLTVGDSAKVNDAACKRLGASGVVKLNKQTIQVIVGAKAESIGDAMKKVVARGPVAAAAASTCQRRQPPRLRPNRRRYANAVYRRGAGFADYRGCGGTGAGAGRSLRQQSGG